MTKIKTTYGIALCRYNKFNETEILLIKKRYTYYFFNFIFGYYNDNDDKYLKYLFDNMCFSEKIDILSMQFNIMWYRIWLNNPETDFNFQDMFKNTKCGFKPLDIYKIYLKKKERFELFIRPDGGKRLKSMIQNSSNSEIIWEIPKGGKEPNETDVDCAIREFAEETSILPKYVKVYYHVKPVIEIFKDDNIQYKNIYFMAGIKNKYKNKVKIKINFDNFEQIKEITNIKWVTLNEIKFLNLEKKTYNKIVKLYKKILKKYKKIQKFNKLYYS